MIILSDWISTWWSCDVMWRKDSLEDTKEQIPVRFDWLEMMMWRGGFPVFLHFSSSSSPHDDVLWCSLTLFLRSWSLWILFAPLFYSSSSHLLFTLFQHGCNFRWRNESLMKTGDWSEMTVQKREKEKRRSGWKEEEDAAGNKWEKRKSIEGEDGERQK